MEKLPDQEEFNGLKLGVMLSIRYHASRESFFKTWQNAMLLIAFMGTTSIFFRILDMSPEWANWLILAIPRWLWDFLLFIGGGERLICTKT